VSIDVLKGATLSLPLRITTGLLADKSALYGWIIEHAHDSIDIEAALEIILDLAGVLDALNNGTLDFGNLEQFLLLLEPCNEASKESIHKHLGKYFK